MTIQFPEKRGFATLFLSAIILVGRSTGQAPGPAKATIPKTWDDAIIPTLEVPLANPIGSPKHISADYYYKIPVRPIYKQYPVYAPGREPAGYKDWLKKQEPVPLWDDAGRKPELRSELAIFLATERCGSGCIRSDFPQAKCSQQIRGQHGFSIDCLDPLLASNLRHFQGNGVDI